MVATARTWRGGSITMPPGVAASIHEGLDEMLTVIRLGLPDELRRSLGCTNAIDRRLKAALRKLETMTKLTDKHRAWLSEAETRVAELTPK
jgi:hypothetical protein